MTNKAQLRSSSIGITLAMTIVFVLMVAATAPAQAQYTFTLIHTFTGAGDGGTPYAGVTLDGAGNVYGTASSYGTHGDGTVYKLKSKNNNWTADPLYSFAGGKDGANPEARVVFGPNGALYSTTYVGGTSNVGTVFVLRPPASAPKSAVFAWDETVLFSFDGADGANPRFGDLLFEGGNIYGTTQTGGSNNVGTVYELTPPGSWNTESILYAFSGSDGAYPWNGVIPDNAGNLYSTTQQGGLHSSGTVFELMYPGWQEILLDSLAGGNGGSSIYAGLVFDLSGNLYGATSSGGSGGGGTVFELMPLGNNNWAYTLLYSFTNPAGSQCGPWGTLFLDPMSGNLYGTTRCDGANQLGSVFELTPTATPPWTYTSLHDFTGGNDGKYPYCNVVFDSSGNLYGTASAGGSQGVGVVWELIKN